MTGTTHQTRQEDIGSKLRLLMARFGRGISLSAEDLAIVGWLYLFEQETQAQGITDAQFRWLLEELAKHIRLEPAAVQPTQVIQRLMRFEVLSFTLIQDGRRGYRLTCLGQSLARNLIDDIDYSSEQLNVLLGCALRDLQAARETGPEELLLYLKHVLLGIIREKTEYKLLGIEDDLEKRKKAVKRSYSGHDQADFDSAIKDIEYCRLALTELVDAVHTSSAFAGLETVLFEQIAREPEPALGEALEQSLNFFYMMRGRVEAMLKDVIQFIRDCVAYRSLALTLDSRDRLCRIQEQILSHALTREVTLPVIDLPRLPRLDFNWSRVEKARPLQLDMEQLTSLETFQPPALPPLEPAWKEPLLHLARTQWRELALNGGVELAAWMPQLMRGLPARIESAHLAVWYLCQDWPQWRPGVRLLHRPGDWVRLDAEWMMEALILVPAARSAQAAATHRPNHGNQETLS